MYSNKLYESESANEKILLPYTYYKNKLGGKGHIWTLLPVLSEALPEEHKKCLSQIEKWVEIMETCGYLIEDINEDALVRHGIPTARAIYGLPQVTHCVIFYFTTIASDVFEIDGCLFQHVTNGILGYGLEMKWKEQCIIPTQEKYETMLALKAEIPLVTLLQLNQGLDKQQKENYKKLFMLGALYFHIDYDLTDLTRDDKDVDFAKSLEDGRVTFPLIHAIHTKPDDDRVLNLFKQKPKDLKLKKECIALLEEFGSIEYTNQKLSEIQKEMLKEVENIGQSDLLSLLMQKLIVQ